MTRGFDFAIVGGGVIGASLAWRLAKEKARVALIDAGAGLAPATNAAAGMLAPSFEHDGADALYDLSVRSLFMWRDYARALEEASGVHVDFRAHGILGLAETQGDFAALEQECASLAARGSTARMVSAREAREIEPALDGAFIGALFAPDDAQVDPRLVLAALRIAFANEGGAIIAARVLKADMRGGEAALALESGERVSAAAAVIATGARAPVEGIAAPPVIPAKGEAAAFDMRARPFRVVVRTPRAYLCPKAGGRLVIGATEYRGRGDETVDAAAIERLRAGGAAAVSAIAGFAELERWAGLRPATPDGAPILGARAEGPENLAFALGHYRNGVLLAPASAQMLADALLRRTGGEGLAPFSPDRFGSGHG